jgi:hypothetical protein
MRVLVLAACIASSLSARAEEQDQDGVRLVGPARSEAIAAGSTGALSLVLITLGGVLAGTRGGGYGDSDRNWRVGLGLVGVGGALVFPATLTGAYAGGHAQGLKRVPLPPSGDEDARRRFLYAVSDAEKHARQKRNAGIGLTVAGALMIAAGTTLALLTFGDICIGADSPNQCRPGNAGASITGMVISSLGDAAFLSGIHIWSYSAGVERGLADTRASLMLKPGGLVARF